MHCNDPYLPEHYLQDEQSACPSSVTPEESVAMRIDQIINHTEKASSESDRTPDSDGLPKIGLDPNSVEAIVYRILSETDQPLWLDEIIKCLNEEIPELQFTREYLLPILTSSTVIRTYRPYALFTFIANKRKRGVKSKKTIQKTKSNLNKKWDKWIKKDTISSAEIIKPNKDDVEKPDALSETLSTQGVENKPTDSIEARPPIQALRGPTGTPNKPKANPETDDNHTENVVLTDVKATDEVIVSERKEHKEVLTQNNEPAVSADTTSDSITLENAQVTVSQLVDVEKTIEEEVSTQKDDMISSQTIEDNATIQQDLSKASVEHPLSKDSNANDKDSPIEANEATIEVGTESVQTESDQTPKKKPKRTKSATETSSKPKTDKEKKAKSKKADKEETDTDALEDQQNPKATKKRKKSKDTMTSTSSNDNAYNLFSELESSEELNLFAGMENKDKQVDLSSIEPKSDVIVVGPVRNESSQTSATVEKVENSKSESQVMDNIEKTKEEAQNSTNIQQNNDTQLLLEPHNEDSDDSQKSDKCQSIVLEDSNGETVIVNFIDPATLSEEERAEIEKIQQDFLNETSKPKRKARKTIAKKKAEAEGDKKFVTTLKTRGSKKNVSIDKESWGSLFD